MQAKHFLVIGTTLLAAGARLDQLPQKPHKSTGYRSGEIDGAIDNLVNESGRTANDFRYVKEHFRYTLGY